MPLHALKNIFHSFVQSHLNYCSLVWGLSPKADLEPLFAEQKKAIRSLMPGFNSNYYKNGILPCHTKAFFTEHEILTIHSIILLNVLTFMFKYHYWKKYLPPIIASIFAQDAPKPGYSPQKSKDWINKNSVGILRNVLSFKGPLFYLRYLTEILETYNGYEENCTNISFKTKAKAFLYNIQSSGNSIEWEGKNTPLYYVPGLPRQNRKNTAIVSYQNSFFS